MSISEYRSPTFLEMFTRAADTSQTVETELPLDPDERWLRHVEIEQAKGALTALFGIDPDDAFAVLSDRSQRHNLKVHVLARRIIDTLRTNDTDPEFLLSARRWLDRMLGGGRSISG